MAESHPEDQSTVRLGGMETSTGSLPPWRARYEDLGELLAAVWRVSESSTIA